MIQTDPDILSRVNAGINPERVPRAVINWIDYPMSSIMTTYNVGWCDSTGRLSLPWRVEVNHCGQKVHHGGFI